MKQPEKKAPVEGAIQYIAEPVFVNSGTETAALEPLFANHFEVMASSTDVFLDIGIIDPRDMQAMVEAAHKHPGTTPSVKFSVFKRVAMSPATFALLAAKTNATMQLMKEMMANARQTQNATK